MKTPALVIAALICGLAASPALGAPERVDTATATGQLDTALRVFVRRAAEGDGAALYGMAWMYHHGLGVPLDYAKARELYFEAAGAGDAVAMTQLGFLSEHGLGAPRDLAAAYCWYAVAAAYGYEGAARRLAALEARGQPAPASGACDVISRS